MESYSYNLIENYHGDKKVIALGKKQSNLVWFLPYTFLYTLFNARRYDILQLGDMLLSCLGWIAKLVNPRIKVVATCHGLDMTFSNRLYQWYLKSFSKGFDLYVPNSSNTAKIASEKGYAPLEVIFPATINEDRYADISYDKEAFSKKYGLKGELVLLTTGRLVPRKGVEWFVRNVLAEFKDENIIYLVAGAGQMQEAIETAVREKGLGDKVKLLGRVSDADLDELYVNSDIFVMPNIVVPDNVEGYGMVAIEAAAAECVVVASALQGIKDAVIPDVTGILVEPENPEAFKEALRKIIYNWNEYEPLKSSGKEYAFNHCTGTAIAKQYADCFERLMK